jgi:methyl-accepting chemotaxis protein
MRDAPNDHYPLLPAPKVKRRVIIIKPKIQTKFVLLMVTFVLVCVLAMGTDFYFFMSRHVQNFMDPSLYDDFRLDVLIFAVKLLFYLIGVSIVAILVSHKIAGPIYRFERSAKAVATGDLTHRTRIRQDDELHEYQTQFNGMIESLQRLVTKDVGLANRVSKQLMELSTRRDIDPELQKRMRELKGELDHIGSNFKL